MTTALPPVWELPRHHPLYYRARRQSHRERGLCLNCCRPAVPGKARCPVCAARARRCQEAPKHVEAHKAFIKRVRQERYEAGECMDCGRVLGQLDDARYKNCRFCRAKRAAIQYERAKQQRAERKAAGLCLRCGKTAPDAGYANCAPCRAKATAAAVRRYREKAHG